MEMADTECLNTNSILVSELNFSMQTTSTLGESIKGPDLKPSRFLSSFSQSLRRSHSPSKAGGISESLLDSVNELLKRNRFSNLISTSSGYLCKVIENLLHYIEEITYGAQFSTAESVFRKVLNRTADPTSESDSCILNLIGIYELQKRRLLQEIEKISKELMNKRKIVNSIEEDLKSSYKSSLSQIIIKQQNLEKNLAKAGPGPLTVEDAQILSDLKSILHIKHNNQILPAVIKLEKVVRVVPSLENFIQQVFSTMKPFCQNLTLDTLIPRLESVLSQVQIGKYEEIVQHFKNIFEVLDDEDLIETIDQVFLFVHQMKGFLKSVRNFFNMPESVSMNAVLLKLKTLICNYDKSFNF